MNFSGERGWGLVIKILLAELLVGSTATMIPYSLLSPSRRKASTCCIVILVQFQVVQDNVIIIKNGRHPLQAST